MPKVVRQPRQQHREVAAERRHMSSSSYFKNNGPGLSWPWPMSCLHREDENRLNRFLNLKGDALSILSPTGKLRAFVGMEDRCMRTLLRIVHLQVSGACFFLLFGPYFRENMKDPPMPRFCVLSLAKVAG